MWKNVAIGLILLLAATVLYAAAWLQSHTAMLYYFTPDSPQSYLSRLKRGMDIFLAKTDFSITFQPFANMVDFKPRIKGLPSAFIFVPEWYLKKCCAMLNLRPLLISICNGQSSYRKILLRTKRMPQKFTLGFNTTLAMMSIGPDRDAKLNSILSSPSDISAERNNPINVPKDTDALFALALGQVDMALMAKTNVNQIAKKNLNILQTVFPLLKAEPIPMPVLSYIEGAISPENIKKLKALFINSKDKKSRSTIMEMLQINDWQIVNN